MIIRKLNITHFRNLQVIDLEAGTDFNLIVGRNAQGKSNLLEALYALSLGRSYRTSSETDVIGFGMNSATSLGVFSDSGIDFSVGITWVRTSETQIRKIINFNGNPVKKLSDFLEKTPMTLLSSDDFELVRGTPDNRRKILDFLCCRIRPALVETLRKYRKIVDERNLWLKIPDDKRDPQLGEVYEQELILLGSEIISSRLKLLDILKPILDRLYKDVFGVKAPELRYHASITGLKDKTQESIINSFASTLLRMRDEENRRKYTLVGPHRDDFDLLQGGKSMKLFSSFGEIRSAAVILKLAEVEMILHETGRQPVILIDDCLNEFDRERIEKFLGYLIGKRQVFYATTKVHSYFTHIPSIAYFHMEKGSVRPCSQFELKAF